MKEEPGGRRVALAQAANILPLKAPRPSHRKRRISAFKSVEQLVEKTRPELPVHVVRPHSIMQKAVWFTQHFPGDVLFAVKTNPDPFVLQTLYDAGIRHFDVASIGEIELVSRFEGATSYFMHPVKSREAIAKAYFQYGIRHFSLDSQAELDKIMDVTGFADDLNLYLRLSIPNDKAQYSLSGKFGVPLAEAAPLMRSVSRAANKFGICFHVGSQCMDPVAYSTTIGYVRDLLTTVDVRLDMIDVGGGFPSVYPGMEPPAMKNYMKAIAKAVKTLPISSDCKLLCEPGRALVAEGGSSLVRVELRKGNALYLNDGVFGSLLDAGVPGFVFPVKAIRPGHAFEGKLEAFHFFGPTCDTMDAMKGPFMLPADIAEGDWIEVGQLGAYGATMRTRFNGFHSDVVAKVADDPIMKMKMG